MLTAQGEWPVESDGRTGYTFFFIVEKGWMPPSLKKRHVRQAVKIELKLCFSSKWQLTAVAPFGPHDGSDRVQLCHILGQHEIGRMSWKKKGRGELRGDFRVALQCPQRASCSVGGTEQCYLGQCSFNQPPVAVKSTHRWTRVHERTHELTHWHKARELNWRARWLAKRFARSDGRVEDEEVQRKEMEARLWPPSNQNDAMRSGPHTHTHKQIIITKQALDRDDTTEQSAFIVRLSLSLSLSLSLWTFCRLAKHKTFWPNEKVVQRSSGVYRKKKWLGNRKMFVPTAAAKRCHLLPRRL